MAAPEQQTQPNVLVKVLLVGGTRPEIIKIAPVYSALKSRPNEFETRLCLTGQHADLAAPLVELFELESDYDLDVMTRDQTLNSIAARIFDRIDGILSDFAPDWVLVQGDTTTAMSSAVAAFNRGARVGHIEAGLRTSTLHIPFPEEMNRRVIDSVSSVHFTPTENASSNLLAESVEESRIVQTGNTVVDALLQVASMDVVIEDQRLRQFLQSERFMVLVTAHRRESFDGGMASISDGIVRLAREYGPKIGVVWPVHPNPNVVEVVREKLGGLENILLIDPLNYQTLIAVLKRADLVMTDSGGIQEEAPTFSVPLLVMRDETERVEGLETGMVKVVGVDADTLFTEASRLFAKGRKPDLKTRGQNPYGDGKAAEKIVSFLLKDRQDSAV